MGKFTDGLIGVIKSKVEDVLGVGRQSVDEVDLCQCSGTWVEDGIFPGGNFVERCMSCDSYRLWIVADGRVPYFEIYSSDEWLRKVPDGKIKAKDLRGREFDLITKPNGSRGSDSEDVGGT